MRHGMELGADDYLAKPFMLDTLYAAVDARLKKAQALREEAEKKLADLRDSISLALPHELRTPLNGIMAYGEILSTDAATLKPEEVAEMGQVIHDSGKRLHRLVENFLIYARVELLGKDPQTASGLRAKRTPQPASIVEASARNQAQTAHRLGDLVLELSVGAQAGLAISEEYLTKIVDEIVHNAFKFSQPGSPVRVAFAEADGVMALTVSDHGRGMSTEHITKVGAYMQFERKLHEQQGLGLGLSIARRLTELHGGSLVIQSHPDTGTTVTVKLPAAS
jgi:two-component system, sensor histidine kinase and response regulator